MANALLSIKDILLVGFFLDIGLTGLPDAAGLVAAGALVFLLPLKMILYFLVFTRFTLKARTSFITTMNLANYSEFGLIVSALAASTGAIDQQWLVVIAIALSISLIIASPLNKHADRIFDKFYELFKRFETKRRHPEEIPFERGIWHIAIVGMGRVGVGAYDWFHEHVSDEIQGFDFCQETVAEQIDQSRNVIHADVTDPDFWRRLPAPDGTLKLVVLALANIDAMLYTVKMLKQHGYTENIAAVARYDDQVQALHEAGVDIAFNIFDEAGAGLAAHACENLQTFCGVNNEKA
jgi:hypothetical protein